MRFKYWPIFHHSMAPLDHSQPEIDHSQGLYIYEFNMTISFFLLIEIEKLLEDSFNNGSFGCVIEMGGFPITKAINALGEELFK